MTGDSCLKVPFFGGGVFFLMGVILFWVFCFLGVSVG